MVMPWIAITGAMIARVSRASERMTIVERDLGLKFVFLRVCEVAC
jgi:hypothetical protein